MPYYFYDIYGATICKHFLDVSTVTVLYSVIA